MDEFELTHCKKCSQFIDSWSLREECECLYDMMTLCMTCHYFYSNYLSTFKCLMCKKMKEAKIMLDEKLISQKEYNILIDKFKIL